MPLAGLVESNYGPSNRWSIGHKYWESRISHVMVHIKLRLSVFSPVYRATTLWGFFLAPSPSLETRSRENKEYMLCYVMIFIGDLTRFIVSAMVSFHLSSILNYLAFQTTLWAILIWTVIAKKHSSRRTAMEDLVINKTKRR